MQKFNNPLDNIKIASPCAADWNKMYGSQRQRFCGACHLNVYNLSDMTRDEAEIFLLNAEDRVCVKFYRRQDGTVLTNNCPVGWQKIKQKVSHLAMAIFSLIIGFCSGVFGFSQIPFDNSKLLKQVSVDSTRLVESTGIPLNSNEIIEEKVNDQPELEMSLSGGISNLDEVKFWIFTERFPK